MDILRLAYVYWVEPSVCLCKLTGLTLILSFALFGQNLEPGQRTLVARNATETNELRQIATVIRTMIDVPELYLDEAQHSIRVKAPLSAIEAVSLLFAVLDENPGVSPRSQQIEIPGGIDDHIRIIATRNIHDSSEFEEAMAIARAVGKFRKMSGYQAGNTIVVRGAASEIALAVWLIEELDQANPRLPSAPRMGEYSMSISGNDRIRISYLKPGTAGAEAVTAAVKTQVRIPIALHYNRVSAIVMRGPEPLLLQAQKMIDAVN